MGTASSHQNLLAELLKYDQEELIENLKLYLSYQLTSIDENYTTQIQGCLKVHPEKIELIIRYIHNLLRLRQITLDSKIILQYQNSLRLITLIIPVLYEQRNRETMLKILWLSKIAQENEEEQASDPPLIISLLKRLVELCFVPFFTIDPLSLTEKSPKNDKLLNCFEDLYLKYYGNYQIVTSTVWKGFLSSHRYRNDNKQYSLNRYLVLSAIYALISQTLYMQEFDETYDLTDIQQTSEIQMNIIKGQIPNAPSLSLFKIANFPEMLISMISYSIYESARPFAFSNMINDHVEQDLKQLCMKLTNTILIGQSLILNVQFDDPEKVEAYSSFYHFKCNNYITLVNGTSFPQILQLDNPIKSILIADISKQIYEYYRSQQQLLKFNANKISYHNDLIILLSYLLLSQNPQNKPITVQNIVPIYILTAMSQDASMTKISHFMLQFLSSVPLYQQQFKDKNSFILPIQNQPLIAGSWADVLFSQFSDEIRIRLLNKQSDNNYTLQLSNILFNVSYDCGPLGPTASQKLVSAINMAIKLDIYLRDPNLAQTALKLINCVFNIIISNSTNCVNLVHEILQISTGILDINKLVISDLKLKQCWLRNYSQTMMNKSFSKNKAQPQLIEDRRESEFKSHTEVDRPQKQEDEDSLCVQYDMTDNIQLRVFLENWLKVDYPLMVKQSALRQIANFLITLLNLTQGKSMFLISSVDEFLHKHQIQAYFRPQDLDKQQPNLIQGHTLLTKQVWINNLKESKVFPYFDKSECAYFRNML